MKAYMIQNTRTNKWYCGSAFTRNSNGKVYTRKCDATRIGRLAADRWGLTDLEVLIWEWELTDDNFKSVRRVGA